MRPGGIRKLLPINSFLPSPYLVACLLAIVSFVSLRHWPQPIPPLVSVIVPCLDCQSDWLHQTLNSISLNQIFQNDLVEVIVVDNNSSQTPPILPDGMRVVYHPKENNSLAIACNFGAAQASGKFLLFLNPHSLISEDAIEKLLMAYSLHQRLDSRTSFIYSAVKHVWDDGRPNSVDAIPFRPELLLKKNLSAFFVLLPSKLYWMIGGMCESLKQLEDYDLLLRLIGLKLRGILLNEPLLTYRRHKSSQGQEKKSDAREELYRNNPVTFGEIILDEINLSSLDYFPCSQGRPLRYSLQKWWSTIISRFEAASSLPLTSLDLAEIAFRPFNHKTVIAMFVPWLQVGGADIYDLEVIKTLAATEKFKFVIITEMKANDSSSLIEEFKPLAEIFCMETLLPRLGVDSDLELELVDYLLKSRQASLIYVRNSMLGYRATERWHGKLKTVDIQHLWLPENNLGWEYSSLPFHQFLHRRLVISNSLANVLGKIIQESQKTPVNTGTIKVIPPAVRRVEEPRTLPLCENPTLAFIGRLEEQKDPLLWVQVASELAKIRNDLLFLMIGDGLLRHQVNQEINSSPSLKNRILTMPFISRNQAIEILYDGLYLDRFGVPRIRDRAECRTRTVLLVTSNNEGIPLVILEAIARNIPSVAANVGALEEARDDLGDACLLLVHDQSTKSFVEMVRQRLNGPRCDNLHFPKKYQIETFAQQITEEFEGLIPAGQS